MQSFALLLLVAVGVAGLRLVSEGIHHFTDQWPKLAVIRHTYSLAGIAGPRAGAVQARNQRLVYPYSVVPGGVGSAGELREAAAHDAVVAEHYAGFNYVRAKVVEVDRPRLVYLSYRRGGQIRWSSRQASLRPGEKLITDGKITARARCGNQVSVLPRANTSPEEPSMAELDRPDAVASGVEFPSSFNSNLLQADPVRPIGPGPGSAAGSGPPGTGGGTPVGPGPPGVSVPFPVGLPIAGGGACVPTTKNNNCKPLPPPPPPETVPEPGTIVLVLTGGAAMFARLRQKR